MSRVTILLQIDGGMVLADLFAHLRHEEEVLEGVLHSRDISEVFFVLSLEIEQISENTAETDQVYDWNEHDRQSEGDNIVGLSEILANLGYE